MSNGQSQVSGSYGLARLVKKIGIAIGHNCPHKQGARLYRKTGARSMMIFTTSHVSIIWAQENVRLLIVWPYCESLLVRPYRLTRHAE